PERERLALLLERGEPGHFLTGQVRTGPSERRGPPDDALALLQQGPEFLAPFAAIRDPPRERTCPVLLPEAEGTLSDADSLIDEEVGDGGGFLPLAARRGGGFVGIEQGLQSLELVLLQSVEQLGRHDRTPSLRISTAWTGTSPLIVTPFQTAA